MQKSLVFNLLSPVPLTAVIVLVLLLAGCGYRHPATGKEQAAAGAPTLAIAMWQNQTSELGLESRFFRIFHAWFRQSPRLKLTTDTETADLLLAGRIVSISVPGLYYSQHQEARGVKAVLTVSYSLLDRRHAKTLYTETIVLTEPFLLDDNAAQSRINQDEALRQIGERLAELIHVRTIDALQAE